MKNNKGSKNKKIKKYFKVTFCGIEWIKISQNKFLWYSHLLLKQFSDKQQKKSNQSWSFRYKNDLSLFQIVSNFVTNSSEYAEKISVELRSEISIQQHCTHSAGNYIAATIAFHKILYIGSYASRKFFLSMKL